MKIKLLKKFNYIFLILILLLGLNFFFLPQILHFLSINSTPDSMVGYTKKNSIIKLYGDYLIEYGKIYDGAFYVPVITDSDSSENIRIIACFSMSSEELKKSVEHKYADGYFKNILWEKKKAKKIKKLFSNSKIKISDDVILFDTVGNDKKIIYLFIFDGIVLVLLFIIENKKRSFIKKK